MRFLAALALASVAEAATLTGTVAFDGPAPPPVKLVATTDTAVCGQQDLVDESLVVEAGGLANAVLWIEGSKGGAVEKERLLDNYRCRYEPHVLVARVGRPFTIRNRDRFLHTTQLRDGAKTEFNVALPIRNQSIEKTPKHRGPRSVHCDVHTWMKAWVYVLEDERAAVTGPRGQFAIDGLAPGKHKLRLWHETLGERSFDVEVGGGPVRLTVKPR